MAAHASAKRWMKRTYRERREEGLCTVCGKVRTDAARCESCRAKARLSHLRNTPPGGWVGDRKQWQAEIREMERQRALRREAEYFIRRQCRNAKWAKRVEQIADLLAKHYDYEEADWVFGEWAEDDTAISGWILREEAEAKTARVLIDPKRGD